MPGLIKITLWICTLGKVAATLWKLVGIQKERVKNKKNLTRCLLAASYREEEESLRDKIRADHERALQEAKEKLRKSREELQAEIQTEKNKVMEDLKKKDTGPKPLPPVPMPKVVGVSDGEPPEPDVKEKRDKIREVRRRLTSWIFDISS